MTGIDTALPPQHAHHESTLTPPGSQAQAVASRFAEYQNLQSRLKSAKEKIAVARQRLKDSGWTDADISYVLSERPLERGSSSSDRPKLAASLGKGKKKAPAGKETALPQEAEHVKVPSFGESAKSEAERPTSSYAQIAKGEPAGSKSEGKKPASVALPETAAKPELAGGLEEVEGARSHEWCATKPCPWKFRSKGRCDKESCRYGHEWRDRWLDSTLIRSSDVEALPEATKKHIEDAKNRRKMKVDQPFSHERPLVIGTSTASKKKKKEKTPDPEAMET